MCLGMVLSPITELIKSFKRDVGAITFYQVASLPGGSVSEDKLCCFSIVPNFWMSARSGSHRPRPPK